MDDEESVVEAGASRKRSATKRVLGQNRSSAPQATPHLGIGVGFRATRPAKIDTEKSAARRLQTNEALRNSKESRRQAVWDKLDDAKRKADEKAERWRAFEPEKQNATASGSSENGIFDEFSAEAYQEFDANEVAAEFPSVDFDDDDDFYSAKIDVFDDEQPEQGQGPSSLEDEPTVNDPNKLEY